MWYVGMSKCLKKTWWSHRRTFQITPSPYIGGASANGHRAQTNGQRNNMESIYRYVSHKIEKPILKTQVLEAKERLDARHRARWITRTTERAERMKSETTMWLKSRSQQWQIKIRERSRKPLYNWFRSIKNYEQLNGPGRTKYRDRGRM